MKFSIHAITALAATSSSCFVFAAARKSKKSAKKVTNGANVPYGEPTNGDLIPIGDKYLRIYFNNLFDWIPLGLHHGVCLGKRDWGYNICQSGQPGALCLESSDCVVPPGLEHGVCRYGMCQSGKSGSSCDQTSDCVPISGLNPPHAVCRNNKCQSGKSGSSCGQTSDCVPIAGLNPPRAVCREAHCQQWV